MRKRSVKLKSACTACSHFVCAPALLSTIPLHFSANDKGAGEQVYTRD